MSKFERPKPSSQQAPANPKPIKWRLRDLDTMPAPTVVDLKQHYVAAIRKTAKEVLSAEEVGVTLYIIRKWLEDDIVFREDVEHVRQARMDEIEMDLEGSQNRSGGDVTARIFALKGMRPDKYMERIAQSVYSTQVYEPQFTIETIEPKKRETEKTH